MKKIIKFIFLLFLYFSNISTAIFIYPIIYFIFGINVDSIKWYYFGIIFSIYELGKFFGSFLWDFFSNSFSKIILILISLSFLCILNLLYIFSYNFYHILLIRFLSGFFNNIGKFSKDIPIQLGFKNKLKLIIFFISIVCTVISLLLPSFICHRIINKYRNYNINKIYKITIIFSLINLLSIIMCFILIVKKYIYVKKKKENFVQMNNLEKSDFSRNIQKENTKIPQSTADSNRVRDIEHINKNYNLKIKHKMIDNQNSGRNINLNSYEEKNFSNKYNKLKKNEDISKIGKRSSINLFTKKRNSEILVKEIMNQANLKTNYIIRNKNKFKDSDEMKYNKRKRYVLINILIEISDTLGLIWTLITLYIEYKGNCLYISIVYSFLTLIEKIICFPINIVIIKKSSFYPHCQVKKISRNIIIINVSLFFITILSSSSIYLYYFFKNNSIMLFLLFLSILLKNIVSIINIQYLKIISVKYYNLHITDSLNKYTGSFVKIFVFIIGSLGYNLIYNLTLNSPNKLSALVFILYFIIFPAVINFILMIECKFFI